jgi:hypothetical protein
MEQSRAERRGEERRGERRSKHQMRSWMSTYHTYIICSIDCFVNEWNLVYRFLLFPPVAYCALEWE